MCANLPIAATKEIGGKTPCIIIFQKIQFKIHPNYTWRFAANFLCSGNQQIGTHLPQQKRQSQNTKKELFWGAFPKNKMYLVIKFSTRPYIQLEMGLKPANFVPIPS